MFREEKNLMNSIKDTNSSLPNLPPNKGEEQGGGLSYTKTNNLITALYMVTDIIDKDEPLRFKLRTLGTGIISDINSTPSNACSKISEIMSFLGIAFTMNIVSEMNCNILKKEFLELDRSIKESVGNIKTLNRQIDLAEFFTDSSEEDLPLPNLPLYRGRSKEGVFSLRDKEIPKGHTSIGVQRGGTLMKALSDRIKGEARLGAPGLASHAHDFDILKKQRRDDIISIIKMINGNATIKDIKDNIQIKLGKDSPLMSFSEKTLQRELISMLKDGVLYKTGEKRWSRYQLRINN